MFATEEDKEKLIARLDFIEEYLDDFKKVLSRIGKLATEKASNHSFTEVFNLCYTLNRHVPFIGVTIDSSHTIIRGRTNKKNILYSRQDEISYISEKVKIIQPGRFNKPEEPMFYCSLPVENENVDQTLTAALETCKELTKARPDNFVQDFTFGIWTTKEPIDLINICIDDAHLAGNPSLKESTEEFIEVLKELAPRYVFEYIIELWSFFSKLSTSSAKSYFVTTAFFMSLRWYYSKEMNQEIFGLIYPSAMTEKRGLNAVLTPSCVDQMLKLEEVKMYRFKSVSKNEWSINPCCESIRVINSTFNIKKFEQLV